MRFTVKWVMGNVTDFGNVTYYHFNFMQTQPALTCLKLTIETPEQGVKYVQS